jgi:hypothetical protein
MGSRCYDCAEIHGYCSCPPVALPPLDQLAQAILKIISGETRMFIDATRFHENGCYEISFAEKVGDGE